MYDYGFDAKTVARLLKRPLLTTTCPNFGGRVSRTTINRSHTLGPAIKSLALEMDFDNPSNETLYLISATGRFIKELPPNNGLSISDNGRSVPLKDTLILVRIRESQGNRMSNLDKQPPGIYTHITVTGTDLVANHTVYIDDLDMVLCTESGRILLEENGDSTRKAPETFAHLRASGMDVYYLERVLPELMRTVNYTAGRCHFWYSSAEDNPTDLYALVGDDPEAVLIPCHRRDPAKRAHFDFPTIGFQINRVNELTGRQYVTTGHSQIYQYLCNSNYAVKPFELADGYIKVFRSIDALKAYRALKMRDDRAKRRQAARPAFTDPTPYKIQSFENTMVPKAAIMEYFGAATQGMRDTIASLERDLRISEDRLTEANKKISAQDAMLESAYSCDDGDSYRKEHIERTLKLQERKIQLEEEKVRAEQERTRQNEKSERSKFWSATMKALGDIVKAVSAIAVMAFGLVKLFM